MAATSLPNLAAMQAFRRVVELRSFNAAARSLETTGGHISKQVAALESSLGVRLLQRTTRSLAVTDAGLAFFEATVRVLDDVAATAAEVRDRHAAPAGRLRVAVPTSFAITWLSPRLPKLLDDFPGLQLDLALNDRFVDLVPEGFDCALRIAARLADSNLTARQLGTVARLLVASPGYLRHAPPIDTPEDLASHACLLYTGTAAPAEWPLACTRLRRPIVVDGRFRTDNSLMLREALLADQGVALVPEFAVADLLEHGRLVELLPHCRPPGLVLHGVSPQLRHQPRKTRAFLDFVAAAWGAGH